MNYPNELIEFCQNTIENTGKYNLAGVLKPRRHEILEATKGFPAKISLSMRARAVAENKDCICKYCGIVHGNPEKDFCSHNHYMLYKSENRFTEEEKKANTIRKAIERNEIKFADKEEGQDYLVCQICGCKTDGLSQHILLHDLTAVAYKQKFNAEMMVESRKKWGEDNPGYQHGGRLSKWSKNFIHGYDEEAHKEFNQYQSEIRKDNPTNVFSRAAYNSDEEYSLAQTRDKDYFIRKYGEEEGLERYFEKTRKWEETMDSKSDEEKTEINRKKANFSVSKSKGEIELFLKISKKVEGVVSDFMVNNGLKWFVCDIAKDKKIIEIMGDYWHAHPDFYEDEDEVLFNKLTVKEIRAKDKERRQILNEMGYNVLDVWEHEYNKDPSGTLQACIEFLSA